MKGTYISTLTILEKVINLLPSYAKIDINSVCEYIYEALRKIGGDYTMIHKADIPVEENCAYIDPVIEDIIEITYNTHLLNRVKSPSNLGIYTYSIQGNYIFTDLNNCTIEAIIRTLPTDEEGMPLVPDSISYVEAVVYYVCERIAFKLYIQDQLTKDKYERYLKEWIFYVGQCKTRLLPRKDEEWELMKNMRLIPKFGRRLHNKVKGDNDFVMAVSKPQGLYPIGNGYIPR